MRFASRSLRISNEFKPTLFDSVVLKVPSLLVLGLTGKFGVHSRQVEITATGFLFFLVLLTTKSGLISLRILV